MTLSSILSFISALILAFTVLSAGQAKLTSSITSEVHEKYLRQETEKSSHESYIWISASTLRHVRGVADLICGALLLWPRYRHIGAAGAFALLLVGTVSKIRSGMSMVPPLTMMGLCSIVWFFS